MAHVERAAKEGGFASPSAFIRTSIQRELAGRESEVGAVEERIAATLERLARDIRSYTGTKPEKTGICSTRNSVSR